MNRLHSRSEEVVQFWNFWMWQYMSRNREYIEAYDIFIKARIPKWIKNEAEKIFQCELTEEMTRSLLNAADDKTYESMQKFMELMNLSDAWKTKIKINQFSEKTWEFRDERRKPFDTIFYCSPKNPFEDNDSAKILENALNDKLFKDIKDFNPKTFEKSIVKSIEPTQFTYFVDTEKRPLEQVVAEITYWYKIHSIPNKPGEHKREYNKLVKGFIDNSSSGFIMDDKIRAIGLFLCDCKKIMGKESGKSTSIRNAADYLYKEFKLDRFGYELPEYASNSLRRFERLHKKTIECIKKREVLPLK